MKPKLTSLAENKSIKSISHSVTLFRNWIKLLVENSDKGNYGYIKKKEKYQSQVSTNKRNRRKKRCNSVYVLTAYSVYIFHTSVVNIVDTPLLKSVLNKNILKHNAKI